MIRAGKLRHQVDLQERVSDPDAMGDLADEWATYATVWCAVEPVSGQEVEVAKVLDARVTHKIRMRYQPDLHPTHRILFGTRVMHIKDVRTWEERGAETVVLAEEQV